MIINKLDEDLHIYMLNVGQGDTTIVVSPRGNVIIIDAMKPPKVSSFLKKIGNNDEIEHLIITHPHDDHYGACNNLAKNLKIKKATLAPFWHAFGMGPVTYRKIIAQLETDNVPINFLSGYSRFYPDDIFYPHNPGEEPKIDPDQPYLELLGPSNSLVRTLEEAKVFNTNHLSIMCRLTWGNFGAIITGDAQMENWANFDEEKLLEGKCQVLQAAHHGSKNGTQWERLERLNPNAIIVSSDPEIQDKLPDLCGSAIFTEYDNSNTKFACITRDTGTIHLQVSWNNNRSFRMMEDSRAQNVDFNKATPLDEVSNPTNWSSLLKFRMDNL